jgi:hypothetical protein
MEMQTRVGARMMATIWVSNACLFQGLSERGMRAA